MEGKKLQDALRKSGIVKKNGDHNTVDEQVLEKLFLGMAVGMRGDLPNSTWPRAMNGLDVAPDALYCTCLPFLLRAESGHVLFVKALENIDGFSVKRVRVVREKGRKRKRAESDAESS